MVYTMLGFSILRVRQSRQTGVVLPLAMILLVVISLIAVVSMRGSISAEQVTRNLNANASAMQAAETALRFCESRLTSGAALVINGVSVDGEPILWKTRSNWDNTAITNFLTTAQATSGSNARPAPVPRCMVETYRLLKADAEKITPRDPFLITAVGYTSDYRTSNNVVVSGGEVWLQSVLRLP